MKLSFSYFFDGFSTVHEILCVMFSIRTQPCTSKYTNIWSAGMRKSWKKYWKTQFQKKILFRNILSIYTKYPVKYEVQRSLFTMRNKIHKPSGWILRWMYSFEQDITQYWRLASRESWISPIFCDFRFSLNFRRTKKYFYLFDFKIFGFFEKLRVWIVHFWHLSL